MFRCVKYFDFQVQDHRVQLDDLKQQMYRSVEFARSSVSRITTRPVLPRSINTSRSGQVVSVYGVNNPQQMSRMRPLLQAQAIAVFSEADALRSMDGARYRLEWLRYVVYLCDILGHAVHPICLVIEIPVFVCSNS